jgi:hypothetical protein
MSYVMAGFGDTFPHSKQPTEKESKWEYVIFEVFTAVIMKNAVFWDIKTQFVLHRRQITSPLQSPAGVTRIGELGTTLATDARYEEIQSEKSLDEGGAKFLRNVSSYKSNKA